MSNAGIAPPTLSGFLSFIRNGMGIQPDVLPDNSPVIPLAFNIALDIVNDDMAAVSPDLYTLAVYNLAGSNVVNFAPDQGDLDPPQNSFFADLRKLYNINAFSAGVVSAAADVSTSASIEVIAAAKNFTLMNLQNLKDPWGRQYLSFAQAAGPTIWALT